MSAVPKLRFNEFSNFWIAENVLNVSYFVTSGSRDWAKLYSDTGAKFLRMTNLPKNGTDLLLSDMKYVTILHNSTDGRRTSIEKGDILVSITAELGKIGYVKDDLGEAYVNQHLALIRLKKNIVSSKFIAEMLASEKCRAAINRLNDAGAKAGLNLPAIRKFKILIPSLPEQQKIASFLSSVDKKIDLLRQKKDALELYKKGLMQKIFSQEIRFKQDDGSDFPEWEEVALGHVASVTKGKQLNRDTLTLGAAYPVINGGVTPSGYHDEFNTKENSITISEGGNSCGYVDFQRQKFWCGGHCYVLEPTGEVIDKKFAFQSLKYRQEDIMRLRVGSGLPNIQKGDLLKLAMVIPPELDEQKKIASFLSVVDTKIQKTSVIIEQMETFKKGLLQQMFV